MYASKFTALLATSDFFWIALFLIFLVVYFLVLVNRAADKVKSGMGSAFSAVSKPSPSRNLALKAVGGLLLTLLRRR